MYVLWIYSTKNNGAAGNKHMYAYLTGKLVIWKKKVEVGFRNKGKPDLQD